MFRHSAHLCLIFAITAFNSSLVFGENRPQPDLSDPAISELMRFKLNRTEFNRPDVTCYFGEENHPVIFEIIEKKLPNGKSEFFAPSINKSTRHTTEEAAVEELLEYCAAQNYARDLLLRNQRNK